LVAVIDRSIDEPIPVSSAFLNAATHMAGATEELWERQTELELAAPSERITTGLRRQLDTAAAHLDYAVSLLTRSEQRSATVGSHSTGAIEAIPEQHATALEQWMPSALAETLESVQRAAVQLSQATLS
jgi:hypothetical protein